MNINATVIQAIALACILCLVYLLCSNEKAVITVSADSLVCDQLDAKKQCVFSPEATFTVSVNPNASACSIMEKFYKDKSLTFKNGQSLAFIDGNNWECREKAKMWENKSAYPITGGSHSQTVYTMSDGIFKIWIEDLDHIVGPTEYKIQKH